MYQYEWAVCSDVGVIRACNEDNFYLNGEYRADTGKLRCTAAGQSRGSALCAVCDGMGGGQYGEVASLIAAEELKKYRPEQFPEQIECYIRAAGGAICRKRDQLRVRDMGSTLACLSISDGVAHTFNLGDSRIYYLSYKGRLTRLSQDHTTAQRLMAAGLPSLPRDNSTLTQFLGIPNEEMRLEPFVSEAISVSRGDRFLLCSDGLSDVLTDDEIGALLCSRRSTEALARLYIRTALEQGSLDNVTAAVISVTSLPVRMRFWRGRSGIRQG